MITRCLCVVLLCWLCQDHEASVADSANATAEGEPILANASLIAGEFKNNELAASLKYQGRPVIAYGMVEKVTRDCIIFGYDQQSLRGEPLICLFKPENAQPFSSVNTGNGAAVKGRLSSRPDGTPCLVDCTLVESNPSWQKLAAKLTGKEEELTPTTKSKKKKKKVQRIRTNPATDYSVLWTGAVLAPNT
jgi:hypothetical protein